MARVLYGSGMDREAAPGAGGPMGGLWGGAGQARVTDGRRWRRNRERAAGSGASAWWRSTILDGIRDVVFEWHQQYSATVRGRSAV